MTTFIYRCVHPNSSWWRRSSIGAFILTPPDDDVHLSVRSSISWWRRSSHDWSRSHRGSSFWTRCSHQRLHLNGSFERQPFFCLLLSLLRFCCWLALLAAVLFFGWFVSCYAWRFAAAADVLRTRLPGGLPQEAQDLINNCNVFSTTSLS